MAAPVLTGRGGPKRSRTVKMATAEPPKAAVKKGEKVGTLEVPSEGAANKAYTAWCKAVHGDLSKRGLYVDGPDYDKIDVAPWGVHFKNGLTPGVAVDLVQVEHEKAKGKPNGKAVVQVGPSSPAKPPVGPPVLGPAPSHEVENLTVAPSELSPSPLNPRKYFDPEFIEQLSENMKRVGVLQPLVVRRVGKAIQIVAGEQRWRAATKAGLASVPVCVRKLTDEQVLELQIVENHHRRDPRPLEEARAFRRLIDHNPTKHSAESIAATLKVSPKWVWDRMKLLDLVPEVQELLEDSEITAGHAILIARLEAPVQRKLLKEPRGLFEHEDRLWDPADNPNRYSASSRADRRKARSVREVEAWIAEHVRFVPEKAAAAAPLLFGATKEAADAAAAKPGRGKRVVCITHENFVHPDARDDEERVIGPKSWKRADGEGKSKKCEHSVLGIVTVGPEYGMSFDVCINKDKCMTHWPDHVRAKARASKASKTKKSKPGKPAKEAAWVVQQRRQEERWAAERKREDQARENWKKCLPAILESVTAAVKKGSLAELAEVVLDRFDARLVKKARDLLKPGKSAEDVLRLVVLAHLAGQADGWNAPSSFPKEAGRFGGKIGAILKSAAANEKKAAGNADAKGGKR